MSNTALWELLSQGCHEVISGRLQNLKRCQPPLLWQAQAGGHRTPSRPPWPTWGGYTAARRPPEPGRPHGELTAGPAAPLRHNHSPLC